MQISGAEEISLGPEVSKPEESNKTSHGDNLSYDNPAEARSITLNFDSGKIVDSVKDENRDDIVQKQLKMEDKPIHEDGIFDSQRIIPSQVKRGDGGESSFSVGGPLSDVVPYSGPIPFSGSISLRSDSSTTSTRSFAFPV